MKTHVLIVSRTFPKTHKIAGEATNFPELILKTLGLINPDIFPDIFKFHTIRDNYELWDKRIKEVQEGEAILSLRYWSGNPYNSKQVEFCQMDKYSGIGIQKIDFSTDYLYTVLIDGKRFSFSCDMIAEHDGLTENDFEEWYKNYDLSKPMAIIHFTKFRY